MDAYRTEEEQVEALKRWWDENGKSTLAAIVIAISAGFGWQTWQGQQAGERAAASDAYQTLLISLTSAQETGNNEPARLQAQRLKDDFSGSTYASFAALHLARLAVEEGDLDTAEMELRWVLAESGSGSDIARITGLRLARVLAAQGRTDEALAILEDGGEGSYRTAYAVARGDVLLLQQREAEAREAYAEARLLAQEAGLQAQLASLDQKLELLNPVTVHSVEPDSAPSAAAKPATDDSPEEG